MINSANIEIIIGVKTISISYTSKVVIGLYDNNKIV